MMVKVISNFDKWMKWYKTYLALYDWYDSLYKEYRKKYDLYERLMKQNKIILSKFLRYEKMDDMDERAYDIMVSIAKEDLYMITDDLLIEIRAIGAKMDRVNSVKKRKGAVMDTLMV